MKTSTWNEGVISDETGRIGQSEHCPEAPSRRIGSQCKGWKSGWIDVP